MVSLIYMSQQYLPFIRLSNLGKTCQGGLSHLICDRIIQVAYVKDCFSFVFCFLLLQICDKNAWTTFSLLAAFVCSFVHFTFINGIRYCFVFLFIFACFHQLPFCFAIFSCFFVCRWKHFFFLTLMRIMSVMNMWYLHFSQFESDLIFFM